MNKRIFDILVSSFLILILFPIFLLIGIFIRIESRGGALYRQKRVGLNNADFIILKFRTMKPNADQKGLLTIGGRDARITRVGYFLRKYKLDELPQLFNVFFGQMSLVGPRPEVRKYVTLYSKEQLKVLTVRPGITDHASILYANENELLGKSTDPEKDYIEIIMPAKLTINLKYIADISWNKDLKILKMTVKRILFHR